MDAQHPLGFKQFAGRGLRYVAAVAADYSQLAGDYRKIADALSARWR